MSISQCCLHGFRWDGTPTGRTSKPLRLNLPKRPPARRPPKSARRSSSRAFSGAEILDFDEIAQHRFEKLDLPGFLQRNASPRLSMSRAGCGPDYSRVRAVGHCSGGLYVDRSFFASDDGGS
ncbi:uncharacterized protein BP01DRAFT_389380 [Aspergillus saccharolyticus JOP 1030-1]|uniref:Uncharacterized protein n=1 Tax=Aspergillus saccharolyticus JOP 1030-1 TaxID=1450539 RepID=A0A318ZM88_9EURO|nr:hypothetical protein BP01DRAFT_389380 [Aspergillus saccharolyticus JOP 1030-1]PYH48077.1 hypothetical protein BP01DRAFT_389380 [Aspergillus saccharolyticus JOP 1030-1]